MSCGRMSQVRHEALGSFCEAHQYNNPAGKCTCSAGNNLEIECAWLSANESQLWWVKTVRMSQNEAVKCMHASVSRWNQCALTSMHHLLLLPLHEMRKKCHRVLDRHRGQTDRVLLNHLLVVHAGHLERWKRRWMRTNNPNILRTILREHPQMAQGPSILGAGKRAEDEDNILHRRSVSSTTWWEERTNLSQRPVISYLRPMAPWLRRGWRRSKQSSISTAASTWTSEEMPHSKKLSKVSKGWLWASTWNRRRLQASARICHATPRDQDPMQQCLQGRGREQAWHWLLHVQGISVHSVPDRGNRPGQRRGERSTNRYFDEETFKGIEEEVIDGFVTIFVHQY